MITRIIARLLSRGVGLASLLVAAFSFVAYADEDAYPPHLPPIPPPPSPVADVILESLDGGDRTGMAEYLYDPGDSTGRSGVAEDPRTYFQVTPQRYFYEVPRDEIILRDVPDYSPKALLQLLTDLHVDNRTVPRGYYQVSLGGAQAGSQARHLPNEAWAPPEPQPNHKRLWERFKSCRPPKDPGIFRAIVLEKLGTVVAVLPIADIALLPVTPGERPPRYTHPVVFFEGAGDSPSLTVYYERWRFTSRL